MHKTMCSGIACGHSCDSTREGSSFSTGGIRFFEKAQSKYVCHY